MKYNILIITLLLFFFGCKTNKLKLADVGSDQVEFSLAKGACFGTCPVYGMKIYGGGKAEFVGIKHVDKIGTYEKLLNESDYKTLRQTFAESDIHQYKDVYESEIADLPTTTLSFIDAKGFKSIKGKDNRPAGVKELEALLSIIANADDWIATDDSAKENEKKKKEEIIKHEIIIQPKPGTLLPKWFESMKEPYGIRLVTRVSGENNLWLLTYDKSKIEAEEMLEVLKADENIIQAEFNKKVELR